MHSHEEVELLQLSSLELLRRKLDVRDCRVDVSQVLVICGTNWPRHTLFRLSETGALLLRSPSGLLRRSRLELREVLEALAMLAEREQEISVTVCASTLAGGDARPIDSWRSCFRQFSKQGVAIRQQLCATLQTLSEAVSDHLPLADCQMSVGAMLYAAEADSFLAWDVAQQKFVSIDQPFDLFNPPTTTTITNNRINMTHHITVAKGDGIGPEITDATLRILEAAQAPLTYDEIKLGKDVYLDGNTSGVPDEAWETIRRNKLLLKGPITTPQGSGYKSVNVSIRKTFNLFANVRQSKSYAPFVASPHPGLNLVVIRENEEDLYAGIEHQQTQEVTQVLKLITRPGSERIVRYAFEYARAYGRKKVTCMTKDNIMKLTDGLFHQVFDEVAAEYSDIASEHQIIDIGTAKLAAMPEQFDVIVTLNLYGDILSDVAAQIAGSVGLASSANVGSEIAMFEAVHGSAPDIAGRGVANPSGLLLAATQMMVHLGESDVAERIKNAWLCTIEDGIHTADIYRERLSTREVGTADFTQAVIDRLGNQPKQLEAVTYQSKGIHIPVAVTPKREKKLVGIDVFLDWDESGRDPKELAAILEPCGGPLELRLITNRGVKVYPKGAAETFCTDHWRCRFKATGPIDYRAAMGVLARITEAGCEVIKTENLYEFDGQPGYSLGQGE